MNYSSKDISWKKIPNGYQLYLGDKDTNSKVFNFYKIQYSDGTIGEDFYNESRAKDILSKYVIGEENKVSSIDI